MLGQNNPLFESSKFNLHEELNNQKIFERKKNNEKKYLRNRINILLILHILLFFIEVSSKYIPYFFELMTSHDTRNRNPVMMNYIYIYIREDEDFISFSEFSDGKDHNCYKIANPEKFAFCDCAYQIKIFGFFAFFLSSLGNLFQILSILQIAFISLRKKLPRIYFLKPKKVMIIAFILTFGASFLWLFTCLIPINNFKNFHFGYYIMTASEIIYGIQIYFFQSIKRRLKGFSLINKILS